MRLRTFTVPILLIAAAAVLAGAAANAYSSGGPKDNGRKGCTSCHGMSPRGATFVHLDGLPIEFAPGRTYNLTLRVEAESVRTTGFRAGFAVDADGGTLKITDPKKTWFYSRSQTITHTTAGSYDTSWNFAWTAPANQSSAKIHYTGLTVPEGNSSLVDEPWNNQKRLLYAETTTPISTTGAPAKKSPSLAPLLFVAALVAWIACARKETA